ncbi:diguanylate cyclase domain-containing protein [Micromonospora sp. NBC_01813]|uniref:diguanylate cyclase domain-containing protein n=1 Tax=Micromonospora sp. NBC_01813 TaxID=2975988 RepID=UPI00308E8172|nr:GGDEF domain-containing protein [Micromonospora sp. NBC_01813]
MRSSTSAGDRLCPVAEHAELGRQVGLLRAEVARLRLAERQARWAAAHDRLTGLLNRDGFHAAVAGLAGRDGVLDGALLVLDLDRFKPVNDLFGHAVGDAVLVAVARRLAGVDGLVVSARLGGDEFAGFVAGGKRRAAAAAAEVVERLARPVAVGNVLLQVGASVGVAKVTDVGGLGEGVVRADLAMLVAKRAATPIVWWHPDLALHRSRDALDVRPPPVTAKGGGPLAPTPRPSPEPSSIT